MKIIQSSKLTSIKLNKAFQKSKQGRWYHWNRTLILEYNLRQSQQAVATLNIFERMARIFLMIFRVNYFAKDLTKRNVRVIPAHELKERDIKANQQTSTIVQELNIPSTVPELNVPSKPGNQIDAEQLKRILLGTDSPRTARNDFAKFIPAFEKYKLNLDVQKEFGNTNTQETLYVDFNGFGQANSLGEPNLQQFMRYLVMTGEFFGFSKARVGYCLHLKDPGIRKIGENHTPLITKELLLKTDQQYQLQDTKFKKIIPQLSLKEKEVAEIINNELKTVHYGRIISPHSPKNFVSIYLDYAQTQVSKKVLDHFVKGELIDSWNVTSRLSHIHIKIASEDLEEKCDYNFKKWRNQDSIKQEENFKEQNKVVLTLEHAKAIKDKYGDVLKEIETLIEDLNQRTKNGKFTYKFNLKKASDLLQLLKEKEYIYDFQKINFQGEFDIYVKFEDKPTE